MNPRETIAQAFEPLDGTTPYTRADLLLAALHAEGYRVVRLEQVGQDAPSQIGSVWVLEEDGYCELDGPFFRIIEESPTPQGANDE